jgi:hypothetical protein
MSPSFILSYGRIRAGSVHIICEEIDMFLYIFVQISRVMMCHSLSAHQHLHLIIRLLFTVFLTLIAVAYFWTMFFLVWYNTSDPTVNGNSCECHINHVGTQVTSNMMEQSLMAWYLWKFGLWSSVYACNTHYPWLPVTFIFRRWSDSEIQEIIGEFRR